MDSKRDYVRVEAVLKCSLEKITEVPSAWARSSTVYLTKNAVDISGSYTDHMEPEDMFKLIYAALGEIKDELRAIREKVGLPTEKIDEMQLSLSGSGISFKSDGAFKEGDILLITLVLPLELPLLVKSVGTVLKSDDSGKCVVDFTLIDPEDRELIIRYSFKRQRELIKIKRNEV
jgi:hypothetical protein